ncbi:hypothetical protein [Brevibacillus massiliensis]|uniref:hypothetical protein n=1 Tax=Brevibacillus massiliensis TaxID=1118054 RepID=UPI0036F399BF
MVGKAKPGDSFPIVGTQGDWHQVSLPGGNTAYAASWVVKTNRAHFVRQRNRCSQPGFCGCLCPNFTVRLKEGHNSYLQSKSLALQGIFLICFLFGRNRLHA